MINPPTRPYSHQELERIFNWEVVDTTHHPDFDFKNKYDSAYPVTPLEKVVIAEAKTTGISKNYLPYIIVSATVVAIGFYLYVTSVKKKEENRGPHTVFPK
jgi:hypothetical protein